MTPLAELRRAADCCRDVVAHAREGIAAAGPGFILVVAGDEIGADVSEPVRLSHPPALPHILGIRQLPATDLRARPESTYNDCATIEHLFAILLRFFQHCP
jgi:hypothetical protein